VALTVHDYRRTPGEAFGRMAVRATKTEDGQYEKYRHMSAHAVTHLEAWLHAAQISDGPIFRGILPNRRINAKALCAAEVARTFKVIARLAGIADIHRIGAHSTRIGATHDLKHFGADTLDIMQDGGWKSPMMPKRYLQGLESDRGSMARMSHQQRSKQRREPT
jgi:integrase